MSPPSRIEILDQRNVLDFLEPSDLPRLWDEMYVPWQADAVRLALLAKYGGATSDSEAFLCCPLSVVFCVFGGLEWNPQLSHSVCCALFVL